jgi:hypothetical protein
LLEQLLWRTPGDGWATLTRNLHKILTSIISLNEPDAIEPNLYFADFGPEGIDLREVIIGVRCETKVAEIEAILADHGYTEVKVIKARLSPTSYEVTETR